MTAFQVYKLFNIVVSLDVSRQLMLVLGDYDITINAQHYCRALRDLHTTTKRKRLDVLMLHNNACTHMACISHGMPCSM